MNSIRKAAVCVSLLATLAITAEAQQEPKVDADNEPETVVTTFHVKDGKEAEMAKLLVRAWDTYNKFGMVLPQPNLIVHGTDDANKLFFVEILSWKNHDAPDHAPQEVQAIWNEMQAMCEKRDGHRGIEFFEVHIDNGPPLARQK